MLDVVPIMRSVPVPILVSPAAPESAPPSSSVDVPKTFTIRSGSGRDRHRHAECDSRRRSRVDRERAGHRERIAAYRVGRDERDRAERRAGGEVVDVGGLCAANGEHQIVARDRGDAALPVRRGHPLIVAARAGPRACGRRGGASPYGQGGEPGEEHEERTERREGRNLRCRRCRCRREGLPHRACHHGGLRASHSLNGFGAVAPIMRSGRYGQRAIAKIAPEFTALTKANSVWPVVTHMARWISLAPADVTTPPPAAYWTAGGTA